MARSRQRPVKEFEDVARNFGRGSEVKIMFEGGKLQRSKLQSLALKPGAKLVKKSFTTTSEAQRLKLRNLTPIH